MSKPHSAAAAAPVDADELWEGLLFCEDAEEHEFAQASVGSSNHDDAPNAPGTTPDNAAESLKTTVNDLINGDPEASKVRHCILQLQSGAPCKDADLQQLGNALAAAFPDATVYLREATGSHQRSTCLHRLRHKSLVMCRAPPLAAGDVYRNSQDDTLVIDLSFRMSFSVPSPSPRYQAILDLLPDVFVAPTPSFTAAVEFLAQEMGDSFKFQNMHIPPWRTAPALLSKWSPDTSIDTPLSPAPAPTTPAPQRTAAPTPASHQQPTARPVPQCWPSPSAPTSAARPPKATTTASPPYRVLGIKELLDIPTYSPRRARRRPRSSPTTKPTAPSSSPPAPPSKLRAILSSTPVSYTPSHPLPFKAVPPRKGLPFAAAASPSTPPVKRPFTTTAGAPPSGQACKA